MILLIDNYDSFVYNLARYLTRLGHTTRVVRNDAVTVRSVRQMNPAAIVLSPGPGMPHDAGCCLPLVRALGETIPMLGVCLGHQAIAAAHGARIVRAPEPMHGRTSAVEHDGGGLFKGLASPCTVCRYHSLAVDESTLPSRFQVTARASGGVIIAIRDQRLPLFGVQFHPEAILTEGGYPLLANFLRLAGLAAQLPNTVERVPPARPLDRVPKVPVTF